MSLKDARSVRAGVGHKLDPVSTPLFWAAYQDGGPSRLPSMGGGGKAISVRPYSVLVLGHRGSSLFQLADSHVLGARVGDEMSSGRAAVVAESAGADRVCSTKPWSQRQRRHKLLFSVCAAVHSNFGLARSSVVLMCSTVYIVES